MLVRTFIVWLFSCSQALCFLLRVRWALYRTDLCPTRLRRRMERRDVGRKNRRKAVHWSAYVLQRQTRVLQV